MFGKTVLFFGNYFTKRSKPFEIVVIVLMRGILNSPSFKLRAAPDIVTYIPCCSNEWNSLFAIFVVDADYYLIVAMNFIC